MEQIRDAHAGYRAVYGVRKCWHELERRGVIVGRERIARLMRSQGRHGIQRGRRVRTTICEARADRARDLVERRFQAERPDQLWVADLTYLRCYGGFCYLAFILDVYSRRIVGWQIAPTCAPSWSWMPLRCPPPCASHAPAGLVAHTDRGSQYTSLAYTDRLDQLGIAPSLGSRGDAYDNAMAEAFVATFKAECVRGRLYRSFEQAEHEALAWIGFYNDERLHEALSDTPPAEYETQRSAPYSRAVICST